MKTKKAAATATATEKARKGTTTKASSKKGAVTAKAKKAPAKEKGPVLMIINDEHGNKVGDVELSRRCYQLLEQDAEREGVSIDALVELRIRERITRDKTIAGIESQAGVQDNVKRIMEESGFPQLEIHALCLRAGVNAMIHAMDFQGGFKAPFILAQVPELPPADTLPVWIDRKAVELCREIAAAADIDADAWIEGQIAPHVRDTVTASHANRETGRWIFEGMASDLYNGYEFTPRGWEDAYQRIAKIIERERAAEGIPADAVFVGAEVSEETHADMATIAEAGGKTLPGLISSIIAKALGDHGWMLATKPKTPPDDGSVSMTLHFSAEQWQALEKKASLDSSHSAARFVEGVAAVLACDDECLPLFIPARTVNRLSSAGDVSGIDDFYNGLATEILGDYGSDPQMLREHVENGHALSSRQKRELSKLVSKWKREDKDAAKQKGGNAQ